MQKMNVTEKLANDTKFEIEFYIANIERLGHANGLMEHLESRLFRNKSYLATNFRCYHKKTISSYAIELKIERAKQMIENNEQHKSIMAKLNFANEGHLSNSFKKIVGMTIRDYRSCKQRASNIKKQFEPETMFLI